MKKKPVKITSVLIVIILILIAVQNGIVQSPGDSDDNVDNGVERRLYLTTETADLPLFPLAHNFNTKTYLESAYFRFAEDGAIEKDYRERYDNASWQYSPVVAAAFCYNAYNERVLTNNLTLENQVLQQAYGLLSRSEHSDEALIWRYNFSQDTFGAEPGWISSMAQGLAMACFSGAYLLTGNQSFAEVSYKAYLGLNASFGDNGTRVDLAEEAVFFEEVAGKGSQPSHILNGMIYALGGIWLANEANPIQEYSSALEKGIAGVRILLNDYDVDGTSLYDLGPKRIARLGTDYNLVHVAQMQWLYHLTGDTVFLEKAMSFLSYERAHHYDASASSFIENYGPENLLGLRSYFSVPSGEETNITFNFSETVIIDQINMISYADSTIPESAFLSVANEITELDIQGRFSSFTISPVETSEISIRLVPPEGRRIALFLMSFSSSETRMLTTLSSDLSVYWQPGETKAKSDPAKWSTLNLNDDEKHTFWTTEHEKPWLLIWLEEFGEGKINLQACLDKPLGNFSASESNNLQKWKKIIAADSNHVPVSSEAKYLVIEWEAAGACLADLDWQG
jgi:hypothetical protein